MATYRPSFVDVSGLTTGITRGLEIAAERKRQQDQLAEARIDDFMKMYQPGKLRPVDIPEFTNAFNQYKQSALLYSKMNRGGAKPEQLSAANQQMNQALSNLNSLYGTSVRASEKMAEYADAIKIGRQKGLSIPNDMLVSSNTLASTPVSKLNVDQIPSAYAYKLLSEDYDLVKINRELEAAGAKIKTKTSTSAITDQPISYFGKQPIYGRKIITTESRDPESVMKALPLILQDPTNNGLNLTMQSQYQQFKNSDALSKGAIVESLKQLFPNKNITEENVTPQMILASKLAFIGESKEQDDKDFVNKQIEEIKFLSGIQQKQLDRASRESIAADKRLGKESPNHPYNIISSIISSASGNTPVDASSDLQRYNLMGGLMGGKEMIQSATFNPVSKKFIINTSGRKDIEISPDALISQIVEASGEFKDLGKSVEDKQKAIKESQLSSKAKAAGYTVEEYKKLLAKAGVQIIKG